MSKITTTVRCDDLCLLTQGIMRALDKYESKLKVDIYDGYFRLSDLDNGQVVEMRLGKLGKEE